MKKLLLLAVLIFALAPSARADEAPKFESPEDVIKAAQTIVKDQKTEQLVNLFQPKDRNFFAFSFVFIASFLGAFKKDEEAANFSKDLNELMKKHGVEEKKGEKKPSISNEEEMRKVADESLEKVDKVALVKDLLAFMEAHSDKKTSKGNKIDGKFSGEFKDLKIEGDKASAMGPDGKPMTFAKVDDSWYFSIEPKAAAKPASQPTSQPKPQ